MGQWGFYDDEGDVVADMASEIEHMVLPKGLHSCLQYDKIVKIPCKELKNEKAKEELIQKIIKDLRKQEGLLPKDKEEPAMIIMVDKTKKSGDKCRLEIQTEKTVRCFVDKKKYLETHRKELGTAILKIIQEKEFYQQPHMIAGIALYLARNWHSTPIFPANDTVNRGYGLPKEMPAEFPEKLRKMAYDASKKQLETFDNKMEWKASEKRIKALKNQMRLFR